MLDNLPIHTKHIERKPISQKPKKRKVCFVLPNKKIVVINNGDGTLGDVYTQTRPRIVDTSGQPASGSTKQHYFDSIVGLVSQAFSAWGRNPSTQLVQGSTRVAQQPYTYQGINPYSEQPAIDPYSAGGLGSNAGGAIGGALDSLVRWASQNMAFVVAGGIGLYLLTREPPRMFRR